MFLYLKESQDYHDILKNMWTKLSITLVYIFTYILFKITAHVSKDRDLLLILLTVLVEVIIISHTVASNSSMIERFINSCWNTSKHLFNSPKLLSSLNYVANKMIKFSRSIQWNLRTEC